MSEPTLTSAPDPDRLTATLADGGTGGEGGGLASPPGYALHALVGRGGMGAVYRATDLELQREVAVKILLPNYAPDSATARRFVDEAGITGRLQHPGIPAIYRVGALADGRPFLAMRLIDGLTLEELLREPAAHEDTSDTAPSVSTHAVHERLDRLEAILQRGRLLAIFEQIAQAVGYAHQQNVIHRDLKPANVMVGAFGEVQVMDWGIARSGDRRREPGAREGGTAATVDYAPLAGHGTPPSDLTQAGAILGTPAFMPPEQAIGAVDQIGKRSDVFGLGAILCVILTGEPPFVAENAETTRQLAARGKLDDCFARLDASGAEPELIALAKKCLAPEAADRPANADEVAKAIAGLRAAAEHRARQAETDRATAEVKAAEERKRRRVQRVLALALLVLLGVVGYTARRIDNERTRRHNDHEAQLRQQADDANARVAALKARQLVTERDVSAALSEVQVLREQGLKQADDPERWALTLVAARSALKRAEGLLASGEPSDGPVLRVATVSTELARDDRDCALLAELDRIADGNEVRMLIPVSLTGVASRRYAAAFRAGGIDLAAAPSAEAVAWLKGHRFHDRLVIAARGWVHTLSPSEGAQADTDSGPVNPSPPQGHSKTRSKNRNYVLNALLVVGDRAAPPAPLTKRQSRRERLEAVLAAAVEDPFTREWWEAATSNNLIALKALITRPELNRLSSRELASLSDGLTEFGSNEVQEKLMALAQDRFPGEFWVHFRLAFMRANHKDTQHEALRHLTAAVAARPRSGIARAALGMELLERHKDPAGRRLLKSASEVDPSSPWPHLFLGLQALDENNWTEACAALKSAIRADPDSAYFMIHSTIFLATRGHPAFAVPDEHTARVIEELAAVAPDHPGGADLLGELRLKQKDGRASLAAFRTADRLAGTDYARKPLIAYQLAELEAKARWEGKIDDILSGKIHPKDGAELANAAGYCVLFEKKYALAIRLASARLAADPGRYKTTANITEFAGWAVQAAAGMGADGTGLTPVERSRLRQQALSWLREADAQTGKELRQIFAFQLHSNPDLEPVRAGKLLRTLPPAERDAWAAFWATIPNPLAPAEVVPAPRELKEPR